MPRRRKRARFEQLTEFERGRIIGLREAGLSYRAVASRVQRNSSTVMRVWKQWTDECRTTRKSGSGPRNVTSARDDRHLVRMARTDRTASSRQLAALWSIATGVSLCASSIRRRLLQCGLRARTPLYRIPLTHDHRRLRLQWANQHRDWRADWQHVVFSDESRFNLWYHDGRIRVRRYAGERHLPECIIERHSGRTPGVMVWGAIAYHRRSQLLRIVGNLNSNRYIREVLQPEAVPFLQSLPGAVFQQDNARPHTARIVKSFFAAQQVQLLPWPACSPDMSPIEHVWDVIGRRLARDPRPVASADELWLLPQREMANNQSVRRHLDAFTRGRIIGKLEEGRSVTSVAAEFGIAHSIVSRLWRQFQTTGTAIRGFSSGRPRGTTPADDRYIALQARRNRRQTAGEIARHTTQATGRPISRFTVARRLHGGGLFARRPVRCVPLTPAHRRRRSLWCREHRNWRDNEWGRVLFTDESRFSLSCDSRHIHIWTERGTRNNPFNIIKRDCFGGRGVLVRADIMLGSRTDLHISQGGSSPGTAIVTRFECLYFCKHRLRVWLISDNFIFQSKYLYFSKYRLLINCIFLSFVFGIWGSENPHEYREAQRDFPKVNVWCGLMHDRVTRPFFFYRKDGVISRIHRHVGKLRISTTRRASAACLFATRWLQQPHWGTIVRSSLNDHFIGRWIGRGGPIPWPPRSPDISPLDFLFWGFVKDNVYRRRVSNIDDLKARITTAIASVDADMLSGTWREIDILRATKGTHVEVH
ncbi:Transposable element Tc1 transposase, partial [Stegodyphus mimosarum]